MGPLLALTGDAERFRDGYSWVTVLPVYRVMTARQILSRVLELYTTDEMVNCIVEEANKLPKDSRIPYSRIAEYFEQLTEASPY